MHYSSRREVWNKSSTSKDSMKRICALWGRSSNYQLMGYSSILKNMRCVHCTYCKTVKIIHGQFGQSSIDPHQKLALLATLQPGANVICIMHLRTEFSGDLIALKSKSWYLTVVQSKTIGSPGEWLRLCGTRCMSYLVIVGAGTPIYIISVPAPPFIKPSAYTLTYKLITSKESENLAFQSPNLINAADWLWRWGSVRSYAGKPLSIKTLIGDKEAVECGVTTEIVLMAVFRCRIAT